MPSIMTKKDLVSVGAIGALVAVPLIIVAAYRRHLRSVEQDVAVVRSGFQTLILSLAGEIDVDARRLVEDGTDVNSEDENGTTPLMAAVALEMDVDSIELLLDLGADLNKARSKNGMTVMHLACSLGLENVVQCILNRGVADLNALTHSGWTPFHCAIAHSHASVVKLLLENGVDANCRTGFGATAMHIACQEGDEAMVRLLAENDQTNWNALGAEGALFTPFQVAVLAEHTRVASILLEESKSSVNAPFINDSIPGITPLHVAGARGDAGMVRLLLENNADFHAKTEDKRTPLDFSGSQESSALVLLEAQGKEYLTSDNVDLCPWTDLFASIGQNNDPLSLTVLFSFLRKKPDLLAY